MNAHEMIERVLSGEPASGVVSEVVRRPTSKQRMASAKNLVKARQLRWQGLGHEMWRGAAVGTRGLGRAIKTGARVGAKMGVPVGSVVGGVVGSMDAPKHGVSTLHGALAGGALGALGGAGIGGVAGASLGASTWGQAPGGAVGRGIAHLAGGDEAKKKHAERVGRLVGGAVTALSPDLGHVPLRVGTRLIRHLAGRLH